MGAQMTLEVNQIICGDCLEVMKDWPDNCVDLVLNKSILLFPPIKQLVQTAMAFCTQYKNVTFSIIEMVIIFVMSINLTIFFAANRAFRIIDKLAIDAFACIFAVLVIRITFSPQTNKSRFWVAMTDFLSFTKRTCFNAKLFHIVLYLPKRASKFLCYENGGFRLNIVQFVKGEFGYAIFVLPPLRISTAFLISHDHNKISLILYLAITDVTVTVKSYFKFFLKYCQTARQRLEAVDTGVPVKEQDAGQLPLFEKQG